MRVASPKRGAPERAGLGAWLPYYAGFSQRFASDALASLCLGPNSLVLDPMVGSGTVAVASQLLGTNFVGTDLNPVMSIVAAAKDAAISTKANVAAVMQVVDQLAREGTPPKTPPVFALEWYSPLVWKFLNALATFPTKSDNVALHPRLSDLATEHRESIEVAGAMSLLRAAAIMAAREFASITNGSNPTWPRAAARTKRTKTTTLHRVITSTIKRMNADLRQTFGAPSSPRRILIERADCQHLPLPDASVDAVITSPPYLTRLDYAVATSPELALLGEDGADRAALRGSLMGTTSTVRASDVDTRDLPQPLQDLLRCIAEHPSKESSGYYYKQFAQYFCDARAFAGEVARVLRPGGSAVLVVQDSWYKDIRLPLGEIYLALFDAVCTPGRIVKSERILQHLTQLNRAAANYAKGPPEEHVLLLKRR